ncbi:MAG: AAA family ATPase [Gemmatimonadetes bacterium]|nr:AAA family ATPase [Gemmatimonadota bacterium]
MAKIEGVRIKNFKVLKDVTLGPLNQPDSQPLTPMTVVIGKNGVGKSALFDAFGFLADALKFGVEEACDARGRGGFEKLRTQGQTGPIEFEVYYREHENAWPINYEISIGADRFGRPGVLRERMREDQRNAQSLFFLYLMAGYGLVWKGSEAVGQVDETAEGFDFSEFFFAGRMAKDVELI